MPLPSVADKPTGTILSFREFQALGRDDDGARLYETTVGTYTIAPNTTGFSASLMVWSGVLYSNEPMSPFPIQCCPKHALDAAVAFCYGNYTARVAETPNPKSPWGRNG